jgi:PAT family beta-lactamase induction signal transducer AmpG
MQKTLGETVRSLANRRMLVMLLLGFASGLPLSLTSTALQSWLTIKGVDVTTIGIYSLVGVPYTFKFLWSPAMDRYGLVRMRLGRRRSWLVVTQILLVVAIATMGTLDPLSQPYALGAVAVAIAFFSASQDIAFNAYQTEVLESHERGLGVALSVGGYRLGMLVSGGLSMVLADQIGWQQTFWVMAACMAPAIFFSFLAPLPKNVPDAPGTFASAVIDPFVEFFTRKRAFAMLALVILYRLGDSYASSLTTTFLVGGIGFSQTEVGLVNKGVGVAAVLAGLAIGGALMTRLRLYTALWIFGILQCVTNLSFMALAEIGAHTGALAVVVVLENLAGGMGTTALVALIMGLCNRRFTATQFALLTALSAVGRYIAGPTSGYIVASTDWTIFFFVTALTAIPGLALLYALRERVLGLDQTPEETSTASP